MATKKPLMDELADLEVVLGPFDQYPDLIAAIRRERIASGMSHLAFEERAGLTLGHMGKIENHHKGYGRAIGPVTLPLVLGALDLKLMLVRDPNNVQDVELAEKREECEALRIMRKMGSNGGRSRVRKLTRDERRESARRAARERWKQKRQAGKPPSPRP